jgi:hypothetical protein
MKKNCIILFFICVNYSFSQTINDYKAVVIPLKYELQKSENQYRLQTLTKINLQKAGFQAFYNNEIALADYPDRCSLLYLDVKKENAFLTTKLSVVFKDCYGAVVFQSAVGKSKEKDFEASYVDALNEAFLSVYALEYKYNGNTNFSPKTGITIQVIPVLATPSVVAPIPDVPAVAAIPVIAASNPTNGTQSSESNNKSLLYAQPMSYGYQLINSEPKVVMKLYKTSNAATYIAKKDDVQGALVLKDNQWFFEYYQNDKLISEKIDVKF